MTSVHIDQADVDHQSFVTSPASSSSGYERATRSWATPDAVAASAAMFEPTETLPDWERPLERLLGGDQVSYIGVSPGLLHVRQSRQEGWERGATPEQIRWANELRASVQALLNVEEFGPGGDLGNVPIGILQMCDPDLVESLFDAWYAVGRGQIDWAKYTMQGARDMLGFCALPGKRAPIVEWSDKSRREMTKVAAQVDWTPLVHAAAGWRPGLMTLTYPPHWEVWAADGAVVKAHLHAFRRRLERALGRPLQGMWKLEFQRRGAPHFHLWLLLPVGRFLKTEDGGLENIGQWASRNWADVVDSEGEDRIKHEKAGTNVDFGWSTHCIDPARVATYFAKHNAPGRGSSKEYQHIVPDSWKEHGCGPGRFWGVWGLDKCVVEVEVELENALTVLRTLRRWQASKRVTLKNGQRVPVTVRRQVQRIDRSTGVIRRRWVTKRFSRIAHNLRRFFVENGPLLAAQIARLLCDQGSRRDEWIRERGSIAGFGHEQALRKMLP